MKKRDVYKRQIEDAFEKMGNEIAGVIIEPVAGNMGVVPPKDGYLQKIREITKKYGSVFIVDEVMTCLLYTS